MEKLTEAIADIRGKLREEKVFKHEDDVKTGIVRRLLHHLGWNVFDPSQVRSEFPVPSGRVDFALQLRAVGPVCFIEVKRVGKATYEGEEQLFDYCVKRGVPLAVFTDGRTWSFYLPAGMGSKFEQRRFATVNLDEDEESECSRLLTRYLDFASVSSGQAGQDAQHDYRRHYERIVARQQFPAALESLYTGGRNGLIASFCEEVRKRCGFSPERKAVARFLIDAIEREILPEPKTEPISLVFRGEKRTFRKNRDCVRAVFMELASRDTAFLARCAARIGNLRQQKQGKAPFELLGGWWIDMNVVTATQYEWIRTACEIAGVEFGKDLVVTLKSKSRPDIPNQSSESASLVFGGRKLEFKSNADCMCAVFEELASRDPAFLPKCADKFKYVGRREQDVKTDWTSPTAVRKLSGGWWINTHGGTDYKYAQIRNVCQIAGVEFGKDLVVTLKSRKTK